MKTIQQVDIADKRVLVRVDFNVPLDPRGQVADDTRIRAALPTLSYALEKNARLIVASHLGRPKGQVDSRFGLEPLVQSLKRLLDRPVVMAPDCIGPEVTAMVDGMAPGGIILLENLRFHPEEEKNDDAFARGLAGLCDVYVNDAFAVSHRSNASVVAIVRHAPVSVAGLLLEKELAYFRKAMDNPRRPLVAVVGGAKVSGKLAALDNMMRMVDSLVIGGAMANTFLRCSGHDMGASKIEMEMLETAAGILSAAERKNIRVYLPQDVVAADRMDPEARTRVVSVAEIPPGWMALDIGPATSRMFDRALRNAGTIVWNGPMGVFEMTPFSSGTLAMARSLADSGAVTIVGGGDTDAAVHKSGVSDGIDYISTGGGAFLALLEGRVLPAVAALQGP